MTSPTTSIWQSLVGQCWTDRADGNVLVYLGYATDDPYAVHVLLATRTTLTPLVVVVGRDLLAEGLHAPAGDGDIRVAFFTPGRLCLTIHHVVGDLWIIVDADDVRRFMIDTFALVPVGDETRHINLDRELRALTDPG
jgi:Streptomyces sporulation and cell division protein, SsgA